MREWLLGIVGVVFCGLMIDVLSPNGKLMKLIKGVFGIITTFVIVSPIFNLDVNLIGFDRIEDTALIEDINNSMSVMIRSFFMVVIFEVWGQYMLHCNVLHRLWSICLVLYIRQQLLQLNHYSMRR